MWAMEYPAGRGSAVAIPAHQCDILRCVTWLHDMIRPGAVIAVERMIHRIDRHRYHQGYPPGECPLCPVHVNAMNKHRLRERLGALMEGLSSEGEA